MGKITAWHSWDEYRKDEEWTIELPKGGDLPWALFYPADYSIGASSLGFHYIFRLLRESGIAAERFFAGPVPYRSADSDTMLERFRVITAGIAYEGNAEVFFKWLRGANIPLLPEDRLSGGYPVIGAGGAMTYINPLLLSGVCDFIVLGDALDVMPHITGCLRKFMVDGMREKLWRSLAEHPSVLVPPVHIKNGIVTAKRVLENNMPLDHKYPMHSTWVTPRSSFGNTLLVELQRGCIRNCKYCTLPRCFGHSRYRAFDSVKPVLEELIGKTGAAQIGLVTPEAGDYKDIDQLLDFLAEKEMGVSFASLRLDRLTAKMISALTRGGRHSITVAPETGSDELRHECGKKFTNKLIIEKLMLAKSMGIDQVKLYFMIGLPGETDADVKAAADLCGNIIKETSQNLILSVNPFVPKPGTPWEREGFIGVSEIHRKYDLLGAEIRKIQKKTPQMRLTSPKEAESEFALAWCGCEDSVSIAKNISVFKKIKTVHSNRDKTLLELEYLW
jgi:radical SAM superfamily enzyme YgiQ (UPF0313 family)